MHKTFYHASNLGNLKELLPLSNLHGGEGKVCYLTPFRAYALFYLRDMDINHVTCSVSANGIVTYHEEFQNQLQTIYGGRAGYLYTCENTGQITERHTKGAWAASEPVAVATVEHIEDVYAEILKAQDRGEVKVISYESLSAEAKVEIIEKWKGIIISRNFWNNNTPKARFIAQNFAESWRAAVAEGQSQ